MGRIARVVAPGLPHHVTRRVNFREGWRGHLWQGRFASFVMDEAYLMAAAMVCCEATGRPLGCESFLKDLGVRLGRNLLPGRPGGPRKDREEGGECD